MNREVVDILRNHKHWLDKDCDGWVYMRADLRERDLRRVNLYKMNNKYKPRDTVYVSEFSKNFGFVSKEVYGNGFGRIVKVLKNNEYTIRFDNGIAIIPEKFILFKNKVSPLGISKLRSYT